MNSATRLERPRPTVAVVDDQRHDRLGHAQDLRDDAQQRFGEVLELRCFAELGDAFRTRDIDCVLLDLFLTGIGVAPPDWTAVRALTSQGVPVVVMSSSAADADRADAVLQGGAHDYFVKTGTPDLLCDMVAKAIALPAGERRPSPKVSAAIERVVVERHWEDVLTRRQREVLNHMALGLTNQEIGSQLRIRPETVKDHVQDILERLQARNRAQAVSIGHEIGLIRILGGARRRRWIP